jgi:hypothetical protein
VRNVYSVATNVEALRACLQTLEIGQGIGNLEPQTGVFPDFVAFIIRNRMALGLKLGPS